MYRKIHKLSSPGKKRRLSRQDAHIYDTPQGSFDKGANMDPALAVIYSVITSILTLKRSKRTAKNQRNCTRERSRPPKGQLQSHFLSTLELCQPWGCLNTFWCENDCRFRNTKQKYRSMSENLESQSRSSRERACPPWAPSSGFIPIYSVRNLLLHLFIHFRVYFETDLDRFSFCESSSSSPFQTAGVNAFKNSSGKKVVSFLQQYRFLKCPVLSLFSLPSFSSF